jgi:ribonuclease HII
MLCGIDEAGRGPLAGPVCASAVVLPDDFPTDLLADSKKLKAKQRENARRIITERALAWGVAWASHTEIDSINILQASLLAMSRAFACLLDAVPSKEGGGLWPDKIETETPFGKVFGLSVTTDTGLPPSLTAIVDGLYTPAISIPCTPLVKADDKIPEVMAASILAKTARDQLMEYYGRIYPQYGYEKHKGYPTKEHRRLVQQYGFSPIQRKSFKIGIREQ